MPVSKIEITSTGVKINRGDSYDFDFADFSAGQNSDLKRAAWIESEMQASFEVSQLLSSLPNDDPDKTTNPNRNTIFWRGNGPSRELVSVSIRVSDVTYISGNDPPLNFRLSRIKD